MMARCATTLFYCAAVVVASVRAAASILIIIPFTIYMTEIRYMYRDIYYINIINYFIILRYFDAAGRVTMIII